MNIDYYKLLQEMLTKADVFSLVVVSTISLNDAGKEILNKLQPYLVEAIETSSWPGTILNDQKAKLYKYNVSPNSIKILSSMNNLFSWLQPEFPEDLTFYKKGKPIFVTISHENDCWYEE
jgi:hypothetical protein